MNTLEQTLERDCPIINKEVVLSVQLIFEKGCSCAVTVIEQDYQCNFQEQCIHYKKGNKKCLLFHTDKISVEK